MSTSTSTLSDSFLSLGSKPHNHRVDHTAPTLPATLTRKDAEQPLLVVALPSASQPTCKFKMDLYDRPY
jgi:hypothetical protein